MSKSPNLGLNITPISQDNIPFQEWRAGLDSDAADSNMMLIDTAVKESQEKLEAAVETLSHHPQQITFDFQNATQIGSTAEWTVNVAVPGITADSILWIAPAADCTTEDLELIGEHQISGYQQATDTITFIAREDRPDQTKQFRFQIVRVG